MANIGDGKSLEIKQNAGELIIQEKASGPEMVDLGLPSGNLWAKCNIGAASETAAGKYFAWGDAEGFEASEVSGSMFGGTWYDSRPGKSVTGDISDGDALHNAAFAAYGNGFTIPTRAEFQELIDRTNKSWIFLNGVNGCKFENKTDSTKYIFIPFAGWAQFGVLMTVGQGGYARTKTSSSSSTSYYMASFSGTADVDYTGNKYNGYPIRAIKKQA